MPDNLLNETNMYPHPLTAWENLILDRFLLRKDTHLSGERKSQMSAAPSQH